MTHTLRVIPSLMVLLLALLSTSAAAQTASPQTLTVVSGGPSGELSALSEVNEIRIVFSEPMVTLGRIPARVTAPFVRVVPEIPGTFRWSGTTILIFTPDPSRPLAFATRYEVTVETTAVAVSGRRLSQPHSFSFVTPTVKLLQTSWYRRNGRADASIVVLMRFNQRVRPDDVLAHLSARFEPHAWAPPGFSAAIAARLREADPTALARFDNKVRATRAAASASDAVGFTLTTDWDRKAYPLAPDLVAFESTTPIPSESWVTMQLDDRLPSPAGEEVPGTPQSYVVQVEPAFFVRGIVCPAQCDPDAKNPLEFSRDVHVTDFARAVRATDITNPAAPQSISKPATPPSRGEYQLDQAQYLSLEDAGFASQPPARTYEMTVDANLRASDGQILGYTWLGTVENWHQRPFTSFGDGHGVWETGSGSVLPFYARNFKLVRQWAAPVALQDLMPTLVKLHPRFNEAPASPGRDRALGGQADRIQSHGLDISGPLGGRPTGLVWAAVHETEPIPRAQPFRDSLVRASVVQVTNLGITVKDSPQNTLVFVTRLDTGAPVPGATVSIVNLANKVFWSGTTGSDGVATAPETPLRGEDNWWEFAFIVTAEKDGDVAYTGSDWNEGIQPWDFGVPYNLREATPLLRGTVFSDRGVYRLGEEVQLKAILRHNTPAGIRLLPEGTSLHIVLRDSQDRVVDRRSVKVNAWSSAEWKVSLPADGALGYYNLQAMLESDRPTPKAPEALRPGETPGPEADRYVPYTKVVNGSFLVAAYRRPDFRVDVTLSAAEAIAGAELTGKVTARYLFGATMGARPLNWTFSKQPLFSAPGSVREAFPEDRWTFVGWSDRTYERSERGEIRRDSAALTKAGEHQLALPTRLDAGVPYSYTLEGDVEDVSRQHIANRASVTVHPAPWYVGLRRPSYFTEQRAGLDTEVVTVTPAGAIVGGVAVTMTLTQVQWLSVRRAEGNGFYTWDTERKEVPAGSWTVTTADKPVPLHLPIPNGGYYLLEATAREESGRFAVTQTSFYALGEGYTAWARFDHNRIELVPERQTYKPGDTARIMIQSPWERATALVTTEREGIRSHRQFTLTSTQESISIPIGEQDIPNVFVSVLLIKGRTQAAEPADAAVSGGPVAVTDTSDPGKPAFRLGYVELQVEDSSKRLTLAVKANKEEYRPANTASVTMSVKDRAGRGSRSEVTLWAVDYGVLSLTSYRTPDVLRSVYVQKALQVLTADSRQRIISRRVLTPKGATEGGGGGADAGAGTMRKDFRVLAFWLGSVVTDADGDATIEVKLPESLTTYRIMAVAGDRLSRFGSADTEVRVNKPLTLKATFPRFLAVGDRAHFGAVVTSQLPEAGTATVTITSLDPDILDFTAGTQQALQIAAGGSTEARFDADARKIGRARVQMTVKLANETDAFEDILPVEVLSSAETVAAYGEATDATAAESLTFPAEIVPGFGGLHVELSSTAMVGLGEGARYLVEYPYGCAEQRASRAVAMVLAADLGDAFSLPGVDTAKMRPAAQQTLKELERFQCPSGGFAYWPGNCRSVSAYLTAYVLHVFKTATDLKYEVDPGVRERAYAYLERELAATPPTNEGWWPAYTAWQAFAVKVLAEGGRLQDSNVNRLYGYRDRMPVFALAYLHDAMLARRGAPSTQTDGRLAELRRRMSNAILPEGGSAHVEELSDPYLLWFWNSNIRSTAIVLRTLVKSDVSDAPIRPMVRWMMAARKNGRWGNTQENAHAMEALVAYYRKFETTEPDFTAVVSLGQQELAREDFKGRGTESVSTTVPMADLLTRGRAASTQPLTFTRTGTGTLFYTARLRFAADRLFQDGLDSGIRIERSYEPFVENGSSPATISYRAGDLVRVVLTFHLTKERRYVAVTDPLPAGFEAVESWFATTAASLAAVPSETFDGEDDWTSWWRRGGFDHVERHDDRVQLFATRLSEGSHTFSYIVRATTAGTFRTAPARAEEMYEPEVFGRTGTVVVEVRR
ncbi:MAG TPA: alpha-2-macroglobulin family protein [Vicinamibacterales bacterium]|nr:alpha-2-macroglobulin family protein [Vicinamibacterales bacterium]